jgi:hypothetical protein
VGGTLTVNSSSASTIKGSVTIGDSGVDADRVVNIIGAGTSRTYGLQLTGLDVLTRNTSTTVTTLTASGTLTLSSSATTVSGTLAISSTTASTTTSSGALVVGNGSSGGLGVGGNIHLGGDLNLNSASGQIVVSGTGNTANSKEFRLYRSDGGDWAVFGLTGTAYAGSLTGLGNSEAFIYNANPFRIFIGTAATNRFDFTSSQFKINATTASTGTSSGALVVSGGVGVAKRIYSGEGLDTAGDNATHISFVRNGTISIGPTSAATPKLQVGGGLLLANNSQSVPAWGDVGTQLSVAGAVLTDTSSSGTVSRVVVNSIASSALAASSTTTYTQAATLFISNAPTANTNVTITNAYAIYTAGGRINFQGLPTSSAGLQAGTLWNDGGTLKVA